MSAEISPESEAKARVALADPASMSVTITGRNGFKVTHVFAVADYEVGEIEYRYDASRRTLDVFREGDQAFTEPLPTNRTFTYSLHTRVGGVS